MPALVESVPNFSEGRDKAKVDAILRAMKMDGVYLLDREMDADHNRSVITLVGDPVNVAEAALPSTRARTPASVPPTSYPLSP